MHNILKESDLSFFLRKSPKITYSGQDGPTRDRKLKQWDKKGAFVDLFFVFEKVVLCTSVILRQMYHMIQRHCSYRIYPNAAHLRTSTINSLKSEFASKDSQQRARIEGLRPRLEFINTRTTDTPWLNP